MHAEDTRIAFPRYGGRGNGEHGSADTVASAKRNGQARPVRWAERHAPACCTHGLRTREEMGIACELRGHRPARAAQPRVDDAPAGPSVIGIETPNAIA